MMFFFMQQALAQAKKAEQIGEIPVGCVITKDEEIISYGYNLRETKNNALYHAEIIAIDNACKTINSWRLEGCTIYVTLEPCPMCMGAIINARISTVVFGSWDKKGGCCGG
ncbi:MAG: nucleoside deaminase, partial [Oscillospiraceae bacterium]